MEEHQDTSIDLGAIRTVTDSPAIFDKVEYVYVSYTQMIASTNDFRIAFGDRIPPEGAVKPVVGIIMSHDHAKALVKALNESVAKTDRLMDEARKQKAAPIAKTESSGTTAP